MGRPEGETCTAASRVLETAPEVGKEEDGEAKRVPRLTLPIQKKTIDVSSLGVNNTSPDEKMKLNGLE